MTERENILAILRYQPYERMPVVSFGYWPETLRKWAEEGHISAGEAEGYARCGDNSEADFAIMRRLGFDFNWNACVGGMNKSVFARDYAAIDREIERLRPLIALGGYIPCPDHRIAPDAKFENVQYYCERLASLSL